MFGLELQRTHDSWFRCRHECLISAKFKIPNGYSSYVEYGVEVPVPNTN